MSILGLILLIVLLSALFGSYPGWGYSRGWGYGPFGGIGFIVVVLIILVALGKI